MLSAREQFLRGGATPTSALGLDIEVVEPKSVYNVTTVPLNNNNASSFRNGKSVASHTSYAPLSTTSFSNGTSTEENTTKTGDQNLIEVKKTHNISNLHKSEPIDMEFEDLSLTVSLGFKKGTKEILHEVNGKFPGGQLIAIMGPSGAGKSTLLDALSGFKTTGVQGSIFINGRRRDLPSFRRMSCYITQDDRLQPLLTVKENMNIASDLKLGPSYTYEVKEGRIEEILTMLDLYNHDTTLAKLLSGGQKKRLSIALELINNPKVMFLDEPTTGLDSSSCTKVLELLKELATQGRTIICTIHQPTAKLFQIFDQVYVLADGYNIYQGSSGNLVDFLSKVELPCPKYHNPADYIIELACGEYGQDKINILKSATENGHSRKFFQNPDRLKSPQELREIYKIPPRSENKSLENTTFCNQLSVLMKRGYIKAKRDTTLTHLRIGVNIFVAIILGSLYAGSGSEGSRVLDNYNLLFAILIHHSMTTMMLTVLTFPIEMSILLKEHFNRWYSLKSYYISITLLDLPISILGSFLFTAIIYYWSYQPMEWFRFGMFFGISVLTVFVGQSFGLMIGAWFDVVNGTFLAPVLTIPMMMFAGFGVTLRDLPSYLKWGSHVSYLRYGLEGFVGAIYGENRGVLECNEAPYCHYRYPKKFLEEITMRGDQFWNDFIALCVIMCIFRIIAFLVLRAKIKSVR